MDNFVLNLPPDAWPALSNTQNKDERALFRFFESRRPVVVLANSNVLDVEANEDECNRRGVKVLARKGGGGTVVLMPGCLILTFAFLAADVFSNAAYFSAINGLWIDALRAAGIDGLTQGGISDIKVGQRKIAGTSLFRKKHLAVYQGSLLVDPDVELIAACLKHPSREPDYRNKRSHADFLTTARDLGYTKSTAELGASCQRYFMQNVASGLRQHFLRS